MNLKEKVKELPASPGVYLMKDSLNGIIYVGKSKNLKNRVGSYFQNSKSHSPKVLKLVKNLKDFEYILTDTEFEAFMLECKLIKELKPIYNRQMKSPDSYCYIKIINSEDYPEIKISNEFNKKDEALYFGPYSNKNIIERAINGIQEHYKLRCINRLKKSSSCLNYSLGLCIGPCLNKASKEQFFIIMKKIINFLSGADKSIVLEMENMMNDLSEKYDFENAAKYRDYLSALNHILDRSELIEFAKTNSNIVLLEHLHNKIKIFFIKGNKILSNKKYSLKGSNLEYLKSFLLDDILTYFNDEILRVPVKIGKNEIDELQIIYSYLKNNSNYIIIPNITSDSILSIDKLLSKLLIKPNSIKILK